MKRGGLRNAVAALIVLVSAAGFLMLFLAEDLAASGSSLADLSSSGDYLLREEGLSRVELDRLRYRVDDEPITIPNHGVVQLGDGHQLQVSVSPYPPTSLDLDVDLLLTTLSGEPVAGAAVAAVWDMTIMAHGPFHTDFGEVESGHYAAPFDLFMVGPWQLDLAIQIPGSVPDESITLYVYVWPG